MRGRATVLFGGCLSATGMLGESERERASERERERESNILNGWKILCGEAKETCLAGGIGSYAPPSLFYPCHYSTERP